jgi:hypothetical protein
MYGIAARGGRLIANRRVKKATAAPHTFCDFGKRMKPKKISVNPLNPRYQRSINPYIHLIPALVEKGIHP